MRPQFTRRRFVSSLAALGLLPLRPARAQEWGLDALMAQLAGVRSARARFVEKRYFAMLRKPVESMGVLQYDAPDRLEKIVQKPRPERLLLEGDRVTLEADGGRRRKSLTLGEMPELASLVVGLRATLAGDTAALRQHFDIQFDGPAQRWRLTPAPRDRKAARLVKSLQIFGNGADLNAVEVTQADGDRSMMLMVKEGP